MITEIYRRYHISLKMANDVSGQRSARTKDFNIILLGVTFMFVFTGFQTCGMAEETVLNSYKQNHTDYKGDGFTSLAIIYSVFAAANWIAPSIVAIIGSKSSMIISALVYTLYIATFIKPITATLYAGSVLIGIAAAVLWTGQGNFLTVNSSDSTMGRNSGIFWALMQCSLLFGNLYEFFVLQGKATISVQAIPALPLQLLINTAEANHDRIQLYIVLTAVSGVGTLGMFFLRTSPKSTSAVEDRENLLHHDSDSEEINAESEQVDDASLTSDPEYVEIQPGKGTAAWNAFVSALKLFVTRDMLLLSVTFFYTGLELTFFSGVYTTCVGATKALGTDTVKLVGLTGIFIGVGEIVGGLTFGIFGKVTSKKGREPVVILGLIVHLVAFYLIFLNIPDDAPLHDTHLTAYINPKEVIAVGCGLLLGFADACFNTQCYSIIGVKYAKNSAPAFALFKFEQSLAAAIGFFYSNHLPLKWQLLILVVFGVLGTLSFMKVERKMNARRNQENAEESD